MAQEVGERGGPAEGRHCGVGLGQRRNGDARRCAAFGRLCGALSERTLLVTLLDAERRLTCTS